MKSTVEDCISNNHWMWVLFFIPLFKILFGLQVVVFTTALYRQMKPKVYMLIFLTTWHKKRSPACTRLSIIQCSHVSNMALCVFTQWVRLDIVHQSIEGSLFYWNLHKCMSIWVWKQRLGGCQCRRWAGPHQSLASSRALRDFSPVLLFKQK